MVTPEFIRAGRAVFTVSNDKGDHYTFKINQKKDSPFFVNILTSGDRRYTYAGLLAQNNTMILTTKSTISSESRILKIFNWTMLVIHGQRPLPEGYRIQHEGKCGKCGRALTDPISIETGLGPICRAK